MRALAVSVLRVAIHIALFTTGPAPPRTQASRDYLGPLGAVMGVTLWTLGAYLAAERALASRAAWKASSRKLLGNFQLIMGYYMGVSKNRGSLNRAQYTMIL